MSTHFVFSTSTMESHLSFGPVFLMEMGSIRRRNKGTFFLLLKAFTMFYFLGPNF
jgi:hypothetical protein